MASILIVDDSRIFRTTLKSLFTEAGHNVIAEAGNGLEAYAAYELYKPDIVTMDITMPVMNGIAAVKKIIGAFPDARIVMITAHGDKVKVVNAIKAGAKHYIVKPVRIEKINATLERILTVDESANPAA